MSQISDIANHFISSRASSGPQRIGLVGTGDTLPISFLTASLALKWAEGGSHVMAIEGEEGGCDLGDLLCKKPLPLLEEEDRHPKSVSLRPRIDLVPFCLTPDRFCKVRPARWEKLRRQEEEADLLLVTLPGDATLYLWAPIVRSLHAVVLQTSVREADRETSYRLLRFLYRHNPFLRVYLAPTFFLKEKAQTTASDAIRFYEEISSLAARFHRQAPAGPYLLPIETGFVHAILDRSLLDARSAPLAPLLERLARELAGGIPVIERGRFPRLFASLEAIHSDPSRTRREGSDPFPQLDDYFPLDREVGPKRATLLFNWERRLAVGETVGETTHPGLGAALVRGMEALEWAHDHLPLLARLHEPKIDPTLPPHLVLIAPDYPDGFRRGVDRLALPVVLYKADPRGNGTPAARVSSPLHRSFSPELSSEEEEALEKRTDGKVSV